MRLTVGDTGHGMDAATKARIFEPFFTTKEPGKGTGLGLATVHGIVKQTGGHISVESEVGEGTIFNIYLPRASGSQPESAGAPLDGASHRGTETVLLVEDDEQVRMLAREILERNGYAVLEARGAAEALASAGRRERVDLLVTGVIMPEMNGFALSQRLRLTHPEMRILYVSGYTATVIAEQGVPNPGIVLLQKPFTVSSLTAKVREVLDAPPRR